MSFVFSRSKHEQLKKKKQKGKKEKASRFNPFLPGLSRPIRNWKRPIAMARQFQLFQSSIKPGEGYFGYSITPEEKYGAKYFISYY